jgi:hypothetical protein
VDIGQLTDSPKRQRELGGFFGEEDYGGEPNDLDRVKRRRSAGDFLGNKENNVVCPCSTDYVGSYIANRRIQTPPKHTLGAGPGMVKRRAPKRDPSLPLIKPNGSIINGPTVPHNAETLRKSSGPYDAEIPMKMKIRDLENEISSLETLKKKTISEMHDDESEMLSIHDKIELLQVQKQKLQQSRREKEGQRNVYSSKILKLNTQKKHLEVALDIIGGRD